MIYNSTGRIILAKLSLAIAGLLCVAPHTSAAPTVDPGIVDTVTIDSVLAYRGTQAIVPIYLTNDESLGGLEFVLKVNPSHFIVDSVSFVGTRGAVLAAQFAIIDTPAGTVVAAAVSFSAAALAPGSGVTAKLFVSALPTAAPGTYIIDTVTVDPPGPLLHQTILSTSDIGGGSETVFPAFKSGKIVVTDQQPTNDSVWLADAIGAPGYPVAMTIYALNEETLVDLQIPLEYSSHNLAFDSVTFGGTRGILAGKSRGFYSDSVGRQVLISLEYFDSAPLAPGSGAVAVAHFTISAAAPDFSTITVGTAPYLTVQGLEFTTDAASGSRVVEPSFNEGVVTVDVSTDAIDGDKTLPSSFSLAQNYPNPFNPTTTIAFATPVASHVTLDIYNSLGQKVRRLIDGQLNAGEHNVEFDARDSGGSSLASGVYFYRLSAEQFTATRKMALMK